MKKTIALSSIYLNHIVMFLFAIVFLVQTFQVNAKNKFTGNVIHDIQTPYDWYVWQGYLSNNQYSYTAPNDCGPTSVAMVIRYLSQASLKPTPVEVRGKDLTASGRVNTYPNQLVTMLNNYGVNNIDSITNTNSYTDAGLSDLIIQSILGDHVIITLFDSGKISSGPLLQQIPALPGNPPPACPSNKSCTSRDGVLFAYSNSNSISDYNVGRYYDYKGGHWMVIKGYGTIGTELYVIVYDPNVWITNRNYWYSGGWGEDISLMKGYDRWYKLSEVITAIKTYNGALLRIMENPGTLNIQELGGEYKENSESLMSYEPGSIRQNSDVTIPPGTILNAGISEVKTWSISNIGTTWLMQEYRLLQVAGSPIELLGTPYFPELKSGETKDVKLLFVTPHTPGTYTSTWRVVDPNGIPVTGQLTLSFEVVNSNYTNDKASFIADVNLPDGSVLSSALPFTKTWRLKNTGTSTWGSGYQLAFLRGEQMGAPSAVDVPATAPNQTVDISVPMTAPSTSGDHTGYWRLRNPQGTYFGPEIWVKIAVPPGTPPSSTDIDLVSATYPTVVTPGQTFRPQITVRVNQGQLLASRGDLLRNSDGNLYGAWPHVAVVGTVNAGQNYTFEFYADNPITAPSAEGTYKSIWRVWRNGNWAGPEITIQFDVRNSGGTRPNPPTLSSPGNWSQFLQGNTPQLCVNSTPGLQYYFQIYESHDIPESGWISSNCWTPPALGPYTYKWHVKARNTSSNLESDWSESRYFTINSNQLSMEDIIFSPGSPSSNENIRVYTCVSGFGGIGLGLKIEANTAPDGSANGDWYWIHHLGKFCYDKNNTSTWPTWEDLPLADGVHLIRAVGYGPQGQTMEKYATFTLNRRRPSAPTLVFPSSDAYINSNQVTFRWKASYRANSYQLLVSENSDPTINPIINQTFSNSTTEFTYNFTSAYPNLYWRVIAINELGSTSSQWHFSLDWEAPVSSIVPFTNNTGYETVIPVTWGGNDNLSGIRWYDVQYRDGNRPDSQWVDWLTNVTNITSLFPGMTGHTYYFRSRAMDVAGNLEDWPGNPDGDTYLQIDVNSRPPTPWWNSAYQQKRNLQVLNNDSQVLPAGYPVHLHFDATTTPTSEDLYAASLSATKGDDFRIVYNNSTELPRFLQAFSASQIDIWFDLQVPISSNPGSDITSYQLYYGNPSPESIANNPDLVFSPKVDSNTVGFWRFTEGAGTVINDSSGHGYNGSASNMGWVQGKFGWAGNFNGTNSIINLGSSNSFNLNVFTAEAWIRVLSTGGERTIFRKEASDTSLIYDALTDYNKVVLRLNGGSCSVVGNTQFIQGQWYHVAWVYNGSTAYVYINGQLDNSSSCGQTLRTGSTPLWLGGSGRIGNNYFYGNIQHAKISNIARSSYPYGTFGVVHNEPSLTAGAIVLPPTAGTVDLNIVSVNSYPGVNGELIVEAIVTNQGDISTNNGFYTDLYVNHLPTGAGDYTGSLQFWVNDPIPAGGTVTLTTVIDDPMSIGLMSTLPGEERSWTLYAQADSTGAISEPDKANNISTGIDICVAAGDAYEDLDNTYSGATLFEGPQIHNFDRPGDADWVKFTAQSGQHYVFATSALGPNADTYLYLYDQDGTTLLASNDDYGGTLASQVDWTATADGIYYLMVKQWNPNSGGCGTNYTLSYGGNKIYLPVIRR